MDERERSKKSRTREKEVLLADSLNVVEKDSDSAFQVHTSTHVSQST